MGHLLTVEAPDASGKSTQVNLLAERLKKTGKNVRLIRFPNYGSDACKPAELYLSGVLGKNPQDTNPYAASVFFAVDRYFSYRTDWKQTLAEKDSVIILDRYTTSNAVHQLAKIKDAKERESFLDWLYDFEFTKLELPVPDVTFFLDVPPKVSAMLLKTRSENDSSHFTDIHEANLSYLEDCYSAAVFASDKKGWIRINCTYGEKMRSIDEISDEIFDFVVKNIF